MDEVFGFPSIDPAMVAKYRRTIRGLACVMQFGCVELREIGGSKAFDFAMEIAGEMTETDRAKLYLSMRKAGGSELVKNSIGPDRKKSGKGHHRTVTGAYGSFPGKVTRGSQSKATA